MAIPDANKPWSDAFDWDAVFEEAMAEWGQSGDFSFQVVPDFADPCSNPNSGPPVNGVAFLEDNCGVPFQGSTLALTVLWSRDPPGPRPEEIIQAGIVFRDAVQWAVYEGPALTNPRDLFRVAVHELGHGLGLDHTATVSILQPVVSDIEVPQPDDFAGVAALYGSGTPDGVLSVAPRAVFAASGPPGGPFVPSGQTYEVSNNGGLDLDFDVSADVAWLGAPTGVVALAGGDPNTNSADVAIWFAAAAATLGEGLHVGTLSFTNLTTGKGDTTREVELTVELPDTDGDGAPDELDNCPWIMNGAQANSDLPAAGDACQCSDIDADVASDIRDVVLMERFRLGADLPTSIDGTRCVVTAGLEPCTGAGIDAVRQTLAEAGPALVESCPTP